MMENDENMELGTAEGVPEPSNLLPETNGTPVTAALEDEEEEPSPSPRRRPRVPKQYPGARKDLYPTCRLMWTSCQEKLPDFTLFSESYNEDLVEDRFELITTVQAMPDETERTEPHVTERGLAMKACSEYCGGWQLLKRYIIRAKFSSPDAKLELAGQSLYEDASNFDWSSVQSLIVLADKFTASHLADLTANLNMPATFPAQLTALGVNFNNILTRFRNFEKVTEELTDAKMMAENDLYLKTVEMGQDGQIIFKKETATARLFSYAAMLETVSGVGSASLVGTVTDTDDSQPIEDVAVLVVEKGRSTVTNAAGKYSIKQLASGTCTVQVSAPGYVTYTQTGVVIEPATAKRVNVKLMKV